MITFSKAQTALLSIRFYSSFRKEKAGKMIPFRNRRDAGKKLAQELLHYANGPDVIVLALPRGGVPVAYEVALDRKSTRLNSSHSQISYAVFCLKKKKKKKN